MKKIVLTLIIILGSAVFLMGCMNTDSSEFNESMFGDISDENSKVTIKYPPINQVNKIFKNLAENLPADSYSSDYINGDLFQFTEGAFKDTSHENSKVNVKYPQINNGEYLEVNKIIKEFAESLPSDYYPYDYKNLSLDIAYKIPYESEDYLSIVFEGGGYVRTAAHPNRFIDAININLIDESIVSFSDIYTVNSEVEQIVKDEFCDQFPTSKLKEIGIDSNDESYEDEKERLLVGSPMWLSHINDILNDSSEFYLSKDGVVVCVETIHAVGDYFETEIQYSELNDFLKIKGKPFQFTEGAFKDTSHENSEVNVKYPQINNKEYLEVNKIIKDFAENLPSGIYSSDYTDLHLEMIYKIAYNSEDYLSVVFEGCGYAGRAAHPNHLLRSINIDLSDRSIMSFSDIYSETSELKQIIKDEFREQFVPDKLNEAGIDSSHEKYESTKEMLSHESMDDIQIQYLFSDNSKFYLSENGVVVYVGIPYAIGDYYELEIEYSEFKDFLKINGKPFI